MAALAQPTKPPFKFQRQTNEELIENSMGWDRKASLSLRAGNSIWRFAMRFNVHAVLRIIITLAWSVQSAHAGPFGTPANNYTKDL